MLTTLSCVSFAWSLQGFVASCRGSWRAVRTVHVLFTLQALAHMRYDAADAMCTCGTGVCCSQTSGHTWILPGSTFCCKPPAICFHLPATNAPCASKGFGQFELA